jgi:hypothetical protein
VYIYKWGLWLLLVEDWGRFVGGGWLYGFECVGKLFLAECLLVPYIGYRCRVYEPFNLQLSCINQNMYRVKNKITFFEIFV